MTWFSFLTGTMDLSHTIMVCQTDSRLLAEKEASEYLASFLYGKTWLSQNLSYFLYKKKKGGKQNEHE